jgi:anti-anti-sigma factor
MPTTHLVLDMSGVTVLGAEGLAVLVDTSARLREHGGRLTIAIGDRLGAVLRAVEDARLERTLPLFDTVEHALAAPATREPATQ